MKKSFTQTVFIFVLTIGLLALSACSNSTGSEDDEHDFPEGLRIKLNGSVVVEQLPDQDLTGEFELTPGEETDLITVYFLDHDGEEFQPDEDEYSLGYKFDDLEIVEFEQHEEDGEWSFHLHAESEGITNMYINLVHGGHDDFTSQPIHVHVEAGN